MELKEEGGLLAGTSVTKSGHLWAVNCQDIWPILTKEKMKNGAFQVSLQWHLKGTKVSHYDKKTNKKTTLESRHHISLSFRLLQSVLSIFLSRAEWWLRAIARRHQPRFESWLMPLNCMALYKLLKLPKTQLLHLQDGVITALARPEKVVRIERR